MKIRGYFGAFEGAYVKAIIKSKRLKVDNYLVFLIDTGAFTTSLSEADAHRIGIDYNILPRVEDGLFGIGGSIDTYLIEDAKIIFQQVDGRFLEVPMELPVMKHKITDKKMEEKIKLIPSLLGRDFLNNYRVIIDKEDDLIVVTDEKLGKLTES